MNKNLSGIGKSLLHLENNNSANASKAAINQIQKTRQIARLLMGDE